jgi:prolipoprotein diacylglyceryltransferase
VIAVPIGGALVRIGNLMNSEIVGKYTGTDVGFIFQRIGDTEPRYPTQIFEAIGYVLVFFILWFSYWKTDKKQKEGYIFGVFMMLLWTVRFVIEFWKERQDGEDLTTLLDKGQLLSIPFILVGFYFVLRHHLKNLP